MKDSMNILTFIFYIISTVFLKLKFKHTHVEYKTLNSSIVLADGQKECFELCLYLHAQRINCGGDSVV